MKVSEKTKAAEVLEHYVIAYKNRDLSLIKNVLTKDCSGWGTAIDEYRVGLKEWEEQHQRDWSQSERSEICIVEWVSTPEDASFAAVICRAIVEIEGKEYIFDNLRASVFVRKEDEVWKIAHMHASFPDFRNELNSSFPVLIGK